MRRPCNASFKDFTDDFEILEFGPVMNEIFLINMYSAQPCNTINKECKVVS